MYTDQFSTPPAEYNPNVLRFGIWLVTEDGLETDDHGYSIDASRLWEGWCPGDRRDNRWEVHLKHKGKSFDYPGFLLALRCARRIFRDMKPSNAKVGR